MYRVKVPGLPFNPTKDLPARQTAVYAKYFPQSIFASYTSAHDAVQTGFYKDEVRLYIYLVLPDKISHPMSCGAFSAAVAGLLVV